MRASRKYSRPMECLPLLLAGMARSTYSSGESVSQNAIVGMFTYDDCAAAAATLCELM